MSVSPPVKSKEKSVEYRQKGNGCLENDVHSAWMYYNLALLFAADGSEEMALAYGNRSITLLHLDAYAACVKDIERALAYESLLRPDIIERLKQRLIKATDLMGTLIKKGTYKPDHFKQKQPELYQGAQKTIPSYSAAVKLEYSLEKGRRIVAVCDIPVGSVVVTERPYASVLFNEFANDHCQNCFCCLPLNHVVCKQCVSEHIKFCSEECRDTAWANHHWVECRKLHSAYDFKHNSVIVPLRVLLSTKPELLLNVEPDQLMGIYGSDKCAVSEADDQFKWIASLRLKSVQSEWAKARLKALGEQWLSGLFAAGFLSRFRDAAGFVCDEQSKRAVLRWFDRLVYQCIVNAQPVHRWPFDRHGRYVHALNDDVKIAFGVFPTWSMFNHSCVPNCRSTFINGDQIVVRTVKEIRVGEELCISYGSQFGDKQRDERQTTLLDDFQFECACEGCVDPKYIRIDLETDAFVCEKCTAAESGCGCVLFSTVTHLEAKCLDCGHELTRAAAARLTMLKAELRSLQVESVQDCNKRCLMAKQFCHPNNKTAFVYYMSAARYFAVNGRHKQAVDLLMESCLPHAHCLFGANSMLVARVCERIVEYSGKDKKQARKYRQMADRIYKINFGDDLK